MGVGTGDEQQQRDSAGVRVPPPLIYAGGFGLGVAGEWVTATPDLPTPWAVGAAVAGLVASGLLDVGAMRRFLAARTAMEPWKPASTLVTGGPYRRTRNPMYLGMACLYAGLALAFGLLWSLALLPVVLVVIDRAVVAREERYLQRRFGDAYDDYRRRVRRWV